MAEVSFGEWLKRRRGAEGWTQEQLAQKIHCSTSALRKFESEERRPSAEVAEHLADIFNIPQEERASFLHFARGDWRAFAGGNTEDTPWRISTLDEPSTNLPAQLTSFIGREKEETEISNLVARNRLVTLIGVGGIGKTRLSIQVGSSLLNDFPGGTWFVEFAPLSNDRRVPQAIVNTLGLIEQAERSAQAIIIDFLRNKKALLILDNCEHLIEGCAQLAEILLSTCADVHILATSREAMVIIGETLYPIPPLATPDPSRISFDTISRYEAVQLFIERVQAAIPSFLITPDNASAITQICYHLDGVPLAIELAAARARGLSIEEIASRLNDRFHLLTAGAHTGLPRHQTLQALIDWSHDLLSETERILLRRLAVFAGGWTADAAEKVCAGDGLESNQVLDTLLHLVDKSLVVAETHSAESRYHMLETIRQYAHGKLLEAGDGEAIHDGHLAYFVNLVEQAEPELYRSNQIFWFHKLDNERDNFRTALEWALARDVTPGLRIASIPWRFWQRRDYRELGEWLSQLLERYPKSDSLRAQSLAVYSTYLFACGNTTEAHEAAERGLELARVLSDRKNEALSLLFLGRSIALPGNYNEGTPILEQSLAIYRTLGDKIGQATATGWLGLNHNDLEHSKSLLSEGLKLHRELGNLSGIAWCLAFLAYHAIFGGNFSSPATWLEEAKTLYRQLGDQPNEADTLQTLGMLAHWQGSYQQACAYFEQSIALYEKVGGLRIFWPRVRMGHTFLRQGAIVEAREMFEICLQQFQELIGVVYTVEGLAALHVNQGQPERATRLFAWADTTRKNSGDHRPPVEQVDVDHDITVCREKLGEAAFSNAYEEGKKMSLEEAIAYAREESS